MAIGRFSSEEVRAISLFRSPVLHTVQNAAQRARPKALSRQWERNFHVAPQVAANRGDGTSNTSTYLVA